MTLFRSASLRRMVTSLVLIFLTAVGGCDAFSSVPAGRIQFRNDLKGEKFTTIQISGGGASKALKPGDRFLFPKGTGRISVTYNNGKKTFYFTVKCPQAPKKGVRINLIDIFQGRLDGGCKKA